MSSVFSCHNNYELVIRKNDRPAVITGDLLSMEESRSPDAKFVASIFRFHYPQPCIPNLLISVRNLVIKFRKKAITQFTDIFLP